MSYNIFVDIGSSSDSSPDEIKSISSSLSSGGTIESSSDLSPLSASSLVYDDKPPSSNCENVITSPVFIFEDLAQGVYVTDGCIVIASEYGCGVYANALELFHKKQHHMKVLSSLYSVRTQYNLFDAM